jgi:hypothetical protein
MGSRGLRRRLGSAERSGEERSEARALQPIALELSREWFSV